MLKEKAKTDLQLLESEKCKHPGNMASVPRSIVAPGYRLMLLLRDNQRLP